jgi:hypothetical protein
MLLLALACLVPLVFCIGAFLVNIEMAIRIFVPTLHVFDRIFPSGLFSVWQILSADLSTVSTLIPLMILAFPLGQLIRIHLKRDSDPTLAQRLGPDPYPSHFGFFQVMLGLTGTLYGMYIGLDVSGVSELAGQSPTADSIRQSLDRLLGGTATALLSSLVGLIGAFITARPVPWLFGRVTGIKADETRQTLTATIERLTDDLHGLSQASRTFTDYLNPDTANTVLQRMDRQEAATREACSTLNGILKQMEVLNSNQSIQARQLTVLETLAGVAASAREKQYQTHAVLTAMAASQSDTAARLSKLEGIDHSLQQTNEIVRKLRESAESRHQDTLKTLAGLAAAANAQRDQVQRDQDALRNALTAYLNPKP